jgi:hypothetical protein
VVVREEKSSPATCKHRPEDLHWVHECESIAPYSQGSDVPQQSHPAVRDHKMQVFILQMRHVRAQVDEHVVGPNERWPPLFGR